MAHVIFFIIIGIIILDFLTDLLLGYLNSTRWTDVLPPELEGIYDVEKYAKSQNYERVQYRFGLFTGTLSFLAVMAMMLFGGFAWVDGLVRHYTSNPVWMALLFFGILGFAADLLATPFDIWSTFRIEGRFGFNTTTPRTYILDKLKGWALGAVIGGGLLALIIWIFGVTGPWFWVIAWIVMTLFMIFMTMFYSTLIVPLFNKQVPLESGELREAIEAFARQTGFRIQNIFVMDGSKRSKKANAYFSGFGPRKRVVLFDTLIEQHSVKELVAVLAHEIGHQKKKHILKGMVLSVLQTGLMLFILSLFIGNPLLSAALGAQEVSFHMGILAFGILFSPISMLVGIFMNMISRKHEYEADRFAGEQYDPVSLQLALKKLSVNNLSNLRPHPAYVFVHYSHPPLLARLKALKSIQPLYPDFPV